MPNENKKNLDFWVTFRCPRPMFYPHLLSLWVEETSIDDFGTIRKTPVQMEKKVSTYCYHPKSFNSLTLSLLIIYIPFVCLCKMLGLKVKRRLGRTVDFSQNNNHAPNFLFRYIVCFMSIHCMVDLIQGWRVLVHSKFAIWLDFQNCNLVDIHFQICFLRKKKILCDSIEWY